MNKAKIFLAIPFAFGLILAMEPGTGVDWEPKSDLQYSFTHWDVTSGLKTKETTLLYSYNIRSLKERVGEKDGNSGK